MGPKGDIWILLDEESILHFPSRVIFREIQSREIMPIVFDFRSLRKVETDAFKNLNDSLTGCCQWMDSPNRMIGRRECQIQISRLCFLIGGIDLLDQLLEFGLCKLFYAVDQLAISTLLFIRDLTHGSK